MSLESLSPAVFPVTVLALTFGLLVPLLTVAARALLKVIDGHEAGTRGFANHARYALLVSPSLIPFAWLISKSTHVVERLEHVGACLFHEQPNEICYDAPVVGAILASAFLIAVLREVRLQRSDRQTTSSSSALQTIGARDATEKLNAALQKLTSAQRAQLRVELSSSTPHPIATHGWLRPSVVVAQSFVELNDEDALHAALLHELEHARLRDPLRGAFMRVALALNPAGQLLNGEAARWERTRELECDRAAVHEGANPLALAAAIVRAAKASARAPIPSASVGLAGPAMRWVRLRVTLLQVGESGGQRATLAPSTRLDSICACAALIAVFAAAAAPHVSEGSAYDALHHAVESRIVGEHDH